MNVLTACVVDDEKYVREYFKMMLNYYFPEINIVGEFDNILDTIDFIAEQKVDILFSDLIMPSGSGYDLLMTLKELPLHIVFITGQPTLIKDTFNDYPNVYILGKPVLKDELEVIIKNKILKPD